MRAFFYLLFAGLRWLVSTTMMKILVQTVYAQIVTTMVRGRLSLVEGIVAKEIDLVLVVSHIL